jgi:hypothetical protein
MLTTMLDKSMEGMGDLKIHKMIYIWVVVGDHLSMEWIHSYCLPVSLQHFARLQREG